ncbi:MAG: OsmC family protein [Bauldia sp.]
MADFSVTLRTVPGTRAAIGRAGTHTIVIDRPEGRAGGMGLGFSGGQLLAIAIRGCLCNDLQYAAEKRGVSIRALAVEVNVVFAGEPLLAESAEVKVDVTSGDPGADVDALIGAAVAVSAATNSLIRGVPSMWHEVGSHDVEDLRVG